MNFRLVRRCRDELDIDHVVAAQKELGAAYVAQPSDAVMARMVELGRLGRKSAKGWYDYPEGGKKHLWPGLEEMFPRAAVQPDVEEVKERLKVNFEKVVDVVIVNSK